MNIQIPFTSLSANVYNQDELKDFLESFNVQDKAIQRWIQKTLRKWMINNYPYKTSVTRVPKGSPDWVETSVKDGTLVRLIFHGLEFEDFKQDIEHALGYLKTVRDPSRVGVEQAIREGNKLIKKQNEKAKDLEGKIQKIYEFSDGYSFVSLLDEQALKREGKLMQNCVGSEEQEYLKEIKAGNLEIWSLRDFKNQPHCTIEYLTKTKKVEQIKGKQNEGVVKKYQAYVIEFLKYQKDQEIVKDFSTRDLSKIGIVEINKIWYDIQNLPDDLTVNGDLDLIDGDIKVLPKNLTVNGNLFILNAKIKNLSKGLTVKGTFDLSGAQFLRSITENIKVEGGLNISFSNIEHISSDLNLSGDFNATRSNLKTLSGSISVKGNLSLLGSNIEYLSGDVKVGKSIDLSKTPIKELPKNLFVRKDLLLSHTKNLKTIPSNTRVGRNLQIGNSYVETVEENVKVRGSFNAQFSNLSKIGKNFYVGGDVVLVKTKIKSLPSNMKVYNNLSLVGTEIEYLPDDLDVKGSINLTESSIKKLPKGFKVQGSLLLNDSDIISLPEDLYVGGNLFIRGTKIKKIPNSVVVKGEILT